jgi:hypothetical protein
MAPNVRIDVLEIILDYQAILSEVSTSEIKRFACPTHLYV